MSHPNIVAIIPILSTDPEFQEGREPLLGGRPLFDFTYQAALDAKLLSRRIVSTDAEWIAQRAREAGLEAPFLRPSVLGRPGTTGTQVLNHCLEWLRENEEYDANWIVLLEITHPFRTPGLIDQFISTVLAQEVDSGFLAYREAHSYWIEDADGHPVQIGDDEDVPRANRRPIYRDVGGIASMFAAENIREGRRYGKRVALVPYEDVSALVDLHDHAGTLLGELIVTGKTSG